MRQVASSGKSELTRNLAVFAAKGHSRVKEVAYDKGTVTFPERSFMRSTLEEQKPEIIEALRDTVRTRAT